MCMYKLARQQSQTGARLAIMSEVDDATLTYNVSSVEMSAGGQSAGRVEGGVAGVCELFRLQLMFQQVYQVLWRVRLISW